MNDVSTWQRRVGPSVLGAVLGAVSAVVGASSAAAQEAPSQQAFPQKASPQKAFPQEPFPEESLLRESFPQQAPSREMLPPWAHPGGVDAAAVFGLRGALTQSFGPSGSLLEGGGGAAFWVQVNALRAPGDAERTFRFTLAGSLGANGAGLDGAIASEGAYGFRWAERLVRPRAMAGYDLPAPSLAPDGGAQAERDGVWHALVARLGYAAHLSHDERLESSLIEVPRLELGYQLLGPFAVEARAHAGLVLAGQFVAAEGTRPLGLALAWGGRIALQSRSGTFELGLERIHPTGDALGAMDVADARACVFASQKRGSTLGICGTGRVEQAAVQRADGMATDTAAIYAGLLIGIGRH